MITASHNPKEYNGYKVYGPDGAQLSLDDSNQISRLMNAITDYTKVPSTYSSFISVNLTFSISPCMSLSLFTTTLI